MSTPGPSRSSHNPFRLPPPTDSQTTTPAAPTTSTAPTPNPATTIDEELPPAYTAAPDIQEGETTLEYGPHRPFQQTRPPPPGGNRPGPPHPNNIHSAAGHPLLRYGKLLVYPKGYECDKCHNYGYKHADPSQPCRRCWDTYAKPFQGALVHAYNTERATSPSITFQRPLPTFPGPTPMGQPYPPFLPPQNLRTLSPYTPPPSNAIVYSAGDPRIGGTLCWRCGGRGSVSLFLFDSTTCEACRGIGRVF